MSAPGPFIEEPTCLGHCLHRALVIFAPRPFMGVRNVDAKAGKGDRSDFLWISYADTLKMSSGIARGLASLNIPRRAHIGICAPNCPEWIYADFACALNDYVSVGLHTSWPNEEIASVCASAEVVCACVGISTAKQFLGVKDSRLSHLIILDAQASNSAPIQALRRECPKGITILTLGEVMSQGEKEKAQILTGAGMSATEVVLDRSYTMDSDEKSTFTLIFSSGTSGTPKGILVSKKRWKKDAVSGGIATTPNQRSASYMALAHGADRGIVWQTAFCGGSVGFADTTTHQHLMDDLHAIKPEFFLGLSHTWNHFYYKYRQVLMKATISPLTKLVESKLGSTSMTNRQVARTISELTSSKEWSSLIDVYCETSEGSYTRKKVRQMFRDSLGGSFQTVATGGAHTSEAVIKFMKNVCMVPGNEKRVFNSYGATEFPGISKNGAVSGLVELKLRDLPDMGYTNKDRALHSRVIATLVKIFNLCSIQEASGGVRIEELKSKMKTAFPKTLENEKQQLGVKSHLRTRFDEINDKVTLQNFKHLDRMFADILEEKKRVLEEEKRCLSDLEKSTSKGHSQRTKIEIENVKIHIETLNIELKEQSISIEKFLSSFKSKFGEIRPRGEILVRTKDGSHTTQYWKNPEKSKQTWLEGGWYCTGDVGELEFNPKHDKQSDPESLFRLSECKGKPRILRIIDRCKYMVEIYIRGRSVWVAMQNLEQRVYQKAAAVHQICLVADRNQPVMVAIIVPSTHFMDTWIQQKAEGKSSARLCYKECCMHADFRSAVLAQIQNIGKEAKVKDYEIPKHVILDPEPWTIQNECLSAVGKPKRGYLQSKKYIDELDRLYANDEVKAEMQDLQRRPPSPASSRPGTPRGGKTNGKNRKNGTNGREDEKNSEVLKSILEAIQAAKEVYMKTVLDEKTQRTYFPKDFPFAHKEKYMSFKFSLPRDSASPVTQTEEAILAAEKALNTELDRLKSIGKNIYKNFDTWAEQKTKSSEKENKIWEECLASSEKKTLALVNEMLEAIRGGNVRPLKEQKAPVEIKMDPITGTPVKGQVETLMQASIEAVDTEVKHRRRKSLAEMAREVVHSMKKGKFLSVKAYARVAKAGVYPHQEETLRYQWNFQRLSLEAISAKFHVFCPVHLTFQFDWCWPAEKIKSGQAPAPSIPVGDAKVWCFVSGRLIEKDISAIGYPRYHVLDGPLSTDISLPYQHAFSKLSEALSGCLAPSTLNRNPKQSEDAKAALNILLEFNPHMHSALSRDVAHWTHLRHHARKEFVRDDTPIAVVMKASEAYSDRLALGMPLSLPERSPIPAYANIHCPVHDGYYWLKYKHLKTLVCRIARRLVKMDLSGEFIGISGYNNFGFALSDLATARAAACSVGLHMTYTQPEVEKVLRNCNPKALMVTKEVVRQRKDRWWSIEDLEGKTNVTDVVIMNLDPKELASEQKRMDAKRVGKGRIRLHSLLEFVQDPEPSPENEVLVDPYKCKDLKGLANLEKRISAEHPVDTSKKVNLFTLMYTSGSSGTPKGVMVSTETFMKDIGEPTSASPLVTVSYIPLSHSTDRVKVWEFLVNGGRVGFAFYDALNWYAHEHSKKEGLLDSSGSENNVRQLFEQVRFLKPAAMSCPPRIWNGLYYIFQQVCKRRLTEGLSPTKADENALNYIREFFGPRVSFLATGGAPTRPDVIEFARRLFPKAKFVDSYGTSESGAITSNGNPVWSKGVKVRLADRPEFGLVGLDEGEIQVKSPQVHIGYYKNSKKTKEAWLGDGWYATGDLGRMDEYGKLHVLERISAVRCLRDGSMVFPGKLETIVEQAELVYQAVLDVRPDKNVVGMVVVLDSIAIRRYCAEKGMKMNGIESESKVCDEILCQISIAASTDAKKLNLHPRAMILTLKPWTVENGLLTGSQKKRTKLILGQFEKELGKAYELATKL